jgi:phosphatidylinositol glycan class S
VSVLRETVLGETTARTMVASVRAPRHGDKGDPSVLRRVTAAKGYDILFSLLVPEPENVMAKWNIGAAIDGYVTPFLDVLGNFSAFDVKSQVLYLTRLNLSPKKSGELNVVTQKDLGLAINPVENQLASHVSSNPRLNFLVYVPTLDQSPLHIVHKNNELLAENSFLIPRWGGVTFYNIEKANNNNKGPADVDVDTTKVMGVFLAQLRLLLGLQQVTDADLPDGARFLPLASSDVGIRTWERDFLYRLRMLENLELSRVTLQSLAHLLSQISNIVITDEIGDQVVMAVDSCNDAARHAEVGRLEDAFESARLAFAASEKAFFDPSLLALLYFPEDQKYAIYIPLFLPVGIPVVLSLKTIFMFFKSGIKPKTD